MSSVKAGDRVMIDTRGGFEELTPGTVGALLSVQEQEFWLVTAATDNGYGFFWCKPEWVAPIIDEHP